MTNQQNSNITLPKNIRQIGTFGDKYRIYIEDFVYTYVHRFLHQRKREDAVLAAVLLGKSSVCNAQEYVFISGAQKVDFEAPQERRDDGRTNYEQEPYVWDRDGRRGEKQEPPVSELSGRKEDGTEERLLARQEEFWDKVYQRIKNSFDDLDILGWYFNLDGCGLEVNAQLQQFFEATYKKGSRFLYYEDSLEQNDAFFVQEQHRLQRLSGYAVYYEKNPQMQQFMVEEKERLAPRPLRESYLARENGDEVVQNYRAIMNKLNEKPKKNRRQPIAYVAGAAVLVIVAATAVTQIGNYQNLKVLQQTMQALSGSVNGDESLSAKEDAAMEDNGVSESESDGTAEEADAAAGNDGSNDGSHDASGEESGAVSDGGNDAASDDGNDAVSGDGSAEVLKEENSIDSDGGSSVSDGESAAETGTDTAGTSARTISDSGDTSGQSGNSGYYTVQSGDSLLSISQSVYHTTEKVEEICALNGITDMDVIYVGQTLLLPQ